MIIWIILAIVLLIGFYVISTQRAFVGLDERKKNALSSIGVAAKSRWDALTELAKAVKSYAGHERDTLIGVIEKRNQGFVPRTHDEILKDEEDFRKALSSLNVVVEQYPDLKANTMYQNLMESLNSYEDKVRLSRLVYNDTVTKYNQMVKQIPSSLIAGMFGYKEDDYLEFNDEQKEMPNLDI